MEKRDLFLKLLEAVTPQEKYEVLISNEDNAKMEQQDFKLTVDLNGALKKGIKFGYFKLQQRAGYSVATVTIDLASTQTEVAPVIEPQAVEPETINPQPDATGNSDIDSEIESLRSETDRKAFDKRLDDLAAMIEERGLMEQYEPQLNELADILTEILRKAAAGVM